LDVSHNAVLAFRLLQVDGRLLLRVWCPGGPAAYPDTPPLLALSCGALPGSSLLALTAKLAGSAQALCGSPMVHELAVQLADELEGAAAAAGASRNSDVQLLLPAPPPFHQPLKQSPAAGAANGADDDGYTSEAQQHAAAAEAIMGDDASSSASSRGSSRQGRQCRRPQQQMSPEQQAAESRRLAEHYKQLQVGCLRARTPQAQFNIAQHAVHTQLLCIIVVCQLSSCSVCDCMHALP
jgi:hypothetical protein